MNINCIKQRIMQTSEWVHYWWLENSQFAEIDISYTNVNTILSNEHEKVYWRGGPVKWRGWFCFPQILFVLLGIVVFELVEVLVFRSVVVVFLSLVLLRCLLMTFENTSIP